MKEVAIAALPREGVGKGEAGRCRAEGNIPAIMYGPETEPVNLKVPLKELRRAVREAGGTSSVINLTIGAKTNKVVIRDMQRDPVSSEVTHIDFHAISMTRPINVNIPIHLHGIPSGVKNDGGILQTNMRELEISCLPSDIPAAIDIDVSELPIGGTIHVRDIQVPNARILDDPQRSVVVVAAPTVVKTEAAEAAEAAAAEGAVEGAAEGEAKEEGDKK